MSEPTNDPLARYIEKMMNCSLKSELEIGEFFARQLVEHLARMGASHAECPVDFEGVSYTVTIELNQKPKP